MRVYTDVGTKMQQAHQKLSAQRSLRMTAEQQEQLLAQKRTGQRRAQDVGRILLRKRGTCQLTGMTMLLQ